MQISNLIENLTAGFAGVGAMAGFFNTVLNRKYAIKTKETLHNIHSVTTTTLDEVVTLNGKTIGRLLDDTEARRIIADVPPEQQSSHDKKYIEALHKGKSDLPSD